MLLLFIHFTERVRSLLIARYTDGHSPICVTIVYVCRMPSCVFAPHCSDPLNVLYVIRAQILATIFNFSKFDVLSVIAKHIQPSSYNLIYSRDQVTYLGQKHTHRRD